METRCAGIHAPSEEKRKRLELEKKAVASGRSSKKSTLMVQSILRNAAAYSGWLEVVWYLLVNLVTCYAFLYRGFEWPQEPGNVQRFMW